MILFHFTARHLWDSIKKEGITKGLTPVVKYRKFRYGKKWRWLTSNHNFKEQTWDTGNLILYSRTDVRITLEIDESKLISWLDYCAGYENHPAVKALNHSRYTLACWWLHEGNILPDQFKEICFK